MTEQLHALAEADFAPVGLVSANYRVLGTTVRVESADLEQLQYWDAVLAPMRCPGPAEVVVRMPSEVGPLRTPPTVISGGNEYEWSGNGPIMPPLFVPPFDRWLYLRATAVARAGQAVLLLAEPGAGLTTLGIACAARGAWLLSDGLTPLDPHEYLVSPLHKSLLIRTESLGLLGLSTDHPALRPFRTRGGELGWRANPSELLGHRASRVAADVAAVVVVYKQRRSTHLPRLVPESPSDALAALIQHTAVRPDEARPAVDAYVKLVKQVPSYQLWAGSPRDTAAVVDELLL